MKKIVFLTGAGISAESGIPTFRDEVTGLWENHRVEEVATAEAIKNNPELVYNFINQLRFKYKDCVPNLAHYDIAFVKDDRWDSGTAQNIKRRHNI
jgi:NAD-dependent deacetylase